MRKIFFWNAFAYIIALLGLGLFDMSLTLGQFQGLVFLLWMFYFGIFAAIVNLALAVVAYATKKSWKDFLLATGIMFSLGALPLLFQRIVMS